MNFELREAAQSGDIHALYDVILYSPYVLDNIDAIPFVDTPLHEAAASGEMVFAMEMMNLKPSFARKLNTHGFTPLHVAVDSEHTQLVADLLEADPKLCRVKGREGVTPLHLAVKKGEVDLVEMFLKACPDCIGDVNVHHETVFHIAVKNDRFEVLHFLVEGSQERHRKNYYSSTEYDVVNRGDRDGNTALHLAVYQNQPEAARLLIKTNMIRWNIRNGDGHTILDIIQIKKENKSHSEQDLERIIKEARSRIGW